MYDDNGVDRTPFAFLNAYDAMWMQLGRRLGNPGLADASHYYQALPMTDSCVLASGFCIANTSSSQSALEKTFHESLWDAPAVRGSPYAADDFANWLRTKAGSSRHPAHG